MKKVSILALALVVASKGAVAGGFSLTEYSTTSLGRGFAGMGVVGDDYSAIISNPAGMVLAKDGIQLGASFVDIYADLHDRSKVDGEKDRLNIFSAVPSFFAQASLNDRAKVGLAFYTPYGIGTDYDKNWWGSDEALKSEIIVYDTTFSGAYEISSKLSLGASLSLQYATATLTNNSSVSIPSPSINVPHGLYSDIHGDNGDDLTLAYTLGAMYQVSDNNRFGISYRSKSKYQVKGTHTLSVNDTTNTTLMTVLGNLGFANGKRSGNAYANITLPENIMVSSYHKVDDRLALSASAKWTRWSRFHELNIYSDTLPDQLRALKGLDPNDPVSTTPEHWRNTWTFSVGADYDYSKDWTFRLGLEVEQTPIPGNNHRTARIPDDNRRIASLGASYKFNSGKLDLGYAHIFIDGGESMYPMGFDTEYNLHINMLSAAVQYYF